MAGSLGASPPAVCTYGHPPAEHHLGVGLCNADVYRPELGRAFGCLCPQYENDADR